MIFPMPRGLGGAEDWGRHMEVRNSEISRGVDRLSQTADNQGRESTGQSDFIFQILADMRGMARELTKQSEKLSDQFSFGTFESSVTGGGQVAGSQHSVVKPSWATSAIVTVGLQAISSPGTGWLARIDVNCAASSISSNRTNFLVAIGSMGYEPSPYPAPTHLLYESQPSSIIFSEEQDRVYLRPYGVQVGGGSTSVTHRFQVDYLIFWAE